MDTQAANRIWLPTQPRHYTTREKIPLSRQLLKMGTWWPETCWATYKEQLLRRNKYNTKWHLVGFLFHIELRCTVNHTSKCIRIFKVFFSAILAIDFGYNRACCPSSRKFATYFLKDTVVQLYLQCSSLLTFNVYSVISVVIVVDSKREGSECASVPKLNKRF